MSKTKIVVLRMKEVVYTAVFVGLGILLLIVLFLCLAGRIRLKVRVHRVT